MKKSDFKRGYFDGRFSATISNPIHNNWKRTKSNKVTHFNKEYLKGYKDGFIDVNGFLPNCLC